MKGAAQERARIEAQVADVLEALEMSWITIVLKFSELTHPDRVVAETVTDFEYRQASIKWYLPTSILEEDTSLRRIVIHEIVHVLVAPMEGLVKESPLRIKMCELAVENLTRAFCEVIP